MSTGGCQAGRGCPLFLVFFFLFFVIIVVNEIPVFGNLALFFLVFLFVLVIGDEVQVDGMRLRDLEFRLTLRTTQDLAFFDFIFIHIDFGGTFWTTDHGAILRRVVHKWWYEAVPHHCAAYYIPRYMKSTPERGAAAWNSTAPYLQGPPV
jgi:hypothetical protein